MYWSEYPNDEELEELKNAEKLTNRRLACYEQTKQNLLNILEVTEENRDAFSFELRMFGGYWNMLRIGFESAWITNQELLDEQAKIYHDMREKYMNSIPESMRGELVQTLKNELEVVSKKILHDAEENGDYNISKKDSYDLVRIERVLKIIDSEYSDPYAVLAMQVNLSYLTHRSLRDLDATEQE